MTNKRLALVTIMVLIGWNMLGAAGVGSVDRLVHLVSGNTTPATTTTASR
jgi:hypothetical protein